MTSKKSAIFDLFTYTNEFFRDIIFEDYSTFNEYFC